MTRRIEAAEAEDAVGADGLEAAAMCEEGVARIS
jgi:hypothetical protein